MPNGKEAGVLCANLDPTSFACRIWGTSEYPDFCVGFTPEKNFCGDTRDEGLSVLTFLEESTLPKDPHT